MRSVNFVPTNEHNVYIEHKRKVKFAHFYRKLPFKIKLTTVFLWQICKNNIRITLNRRMVHSLHVICKQITLLSDRKKRKSYVAYM